eukprot:TRINITY_DN11345_c0_g1_i1.p3 TRINITY_DN11345_c0_g1~~TRINITY_DN11345_c0_g1_i1.p3  ORF type:complete len:125 (+),score=37.67 TRINITY_DN11345_c0_g1_i1:614-988(+)
MEHLMTNHKNDVLNTFEEKKQLQIEIERLNTKCKLLEQQVEKSRNEKEELIKKQDVMQEEFNQLSELNDQYLQQIKNQEDSEKLEERMQILNGGNGSQTEKSRSDQSNQQQQLQQQQILSLIHI